MASPVGAPPLAVQPSASLSPSSSTLAATMTAPSISPVTAITATSSPVEDQDALQQQRDKCNRMKGKALNSRTATHTEPCTVYLRSPWQQCRRVRFMLESMKAAGCPVDGDQFVQCDSCEPLISGAMFQKPDSRHIGVLMCQNRLSGKSQDYYDTVLAHELVHAFDYCRAHTDFNSLAHHACTEVRAANLSGECTWLREAKRGVLRLRGHHEECVRRRAVISVLSSPAVRTSEEAKEAVGRVFDRCYRDVQPHGSIPW